MKAILRAVLPGRVWMRLSHAKMRFIREKRKIVRGVLKGALRKSSWITHYLSAKDLNELGLNVARIEDFYSPLPVVTCLEKSSDRWLKHSELVGIEWDIEEMKLLLENLVRRHAEEYRTVPPYEQNRRYGLGFTPLDAMVLYFMIREIQPKRYLEVGSGIATKYCSLAAERNAEAGRPVRITCIEPYPEEALGSIPGIELRKKEVQDVELAMFERLEPGDILFIDSTHIVKIDGDVPYLFLEVLPRLRKGVIVHIHDIPFPYTFPYPPGFWILKRDWPVFWTEAMLLQAFLCHSSAYRIRLSLPLLRYYDECFLRSSIPAYDQLGKDGYDTYSSIWIQKVQ